MFPATSGLKLRIELVCSLKHWYISIRNSMEKNMLRGLTPTDCLNRFYHTPQEVAEVCGDPKSAGKRL
jgi:hypothetical protein